MKFAMNGRLYRGSKPVMWSVVERTALAEAEVEYQDYDERHRLGQVPGALVDKRRSSDAVRSSWLRRFVVIWTTTPWTIPGNQAVANSPRSNTASTR